MGDKNNIVVLILSTNDSRYECFKEAILNSWYKDMLNAGIKCYFYSGDNNKNEIVGNEIRVTASDKLEGTFSKFKMALKLIHETFPNVKLVYRTNLSSYIDTQNFIKFISTHNVNASSYIGVIGKTTSLKEKFFGNRWLTHLFSIFPIGSKITFASGSGFFLGRKNILKIIETVDSNKNYIDDVMIAKVLNVSPDHNSIPLRFDIKERCEHKIGLIEYSFLVNDKQLFHYRFKTKNRFLDAAMLEGFNDKNYRIKCCTK